jgi:hypothetical protein
MTGVKERTQVEVVFHAVSHSHDAKDDVPDRYPP